MTEALLFNDFPNQNRDLETTLMCFHLREAADHQTLKIIIVPTFGKSGLRTWQIFIWVHKKFASPSLSLTKKADYIEFAALVKTETKGQELEKMVLRPVIRPRSVLSPTSLQNIIYYILLPKLLN